MSPLLNSTVADKLMEIIDFKVIHLSFDVSTTINTQ